MTIQQFLKESIDYWYGKNHATVVEKKVTKLDFKMLRNDTDSDKFGEYINLEKVVDYSTCKIVVVELPNMEDKELWEVAEYVHANYSTDYLIPGLSFWQWAYENKPKELQSDTWRWHFCFNSLFRNSDGRWFVPFVLGDSSGFNRLGSGLGLDWDSRCRVVLLETTATLGTDPLPSELSLESLRIRIEKLEKLFNPELL